MTKQQEEKIKELSENFNPDDNDLKAREATRMELKEAGFSLNERQVIIKLIEKETPVSLIKILADNNIDYLIASDIADIAKNNPDVSISAIKAMASSNLDYSSMVDIKCAIENGFDTEMIKRMCNGNFSEKQLSVLAFSKKLSKENFMLLANNKFSARQMETLYLTDLPKEKFREIANYRLKPDYMQELIWSADSLLPIELKKLSNPECDKEILNIFVKEKRKEGMREKMMFILDQDLSRDNLKLMLRASTFMPMKSIQTALSLDDRHMKEYIKNVYGENLFNVADSKADISMLDYFPEKIKKADKNRIDMILDKNKDPNKECDLFFAAFSRHISDEDFKRLFDKRLDYRTIGDVAYVMEHGGISDEELNMIIDTEKAKDKTAKDDSKTVEEWESEKDAGMAALEIVRERIDNGIIKPETESEYEFLI